MLSLAHFTLFLFLFGRNKEGQLADAASETLDLYGQLPNAGGETFHEAQQIVCGKNATFVIKSNGDVYSCGEGSNGRLGHGHSDDIGSLQIIAGTYLCDAICCNNIAEIISILFLLFQ